MSRESARTGDPTGRPPHRSGTVRRALVERLSTLAESGDAERIVEDACNAESISTVPPIGEALAAFVSGPLRAQTARVLGPNAATSLVDSLAPMLKLAVSPPAENLYLRMTRRPSNPNYGAAPAATPVAPVTLEALLAGKDDSGAMGPHAVPRGLSHASGEIEIVGTPRLPRVLVATHDGERFAAISGAIDGAFEVRRVDDVIELFDALGWSQNEIVTIVLDARDASVSPTTIAANRTELPAEVEIVLWGIDAAEGKDLAPIADASAQWTRIDSRATPTEVAAYLRDSASRRSNGASISRRR